MRIIFKILSYTFVIVGLTSLGISFYLFFSNSQYFVYGGLFNLENANKLGGFIAGLTGFFFTGTGTFLVFLTFEQQRNQFKLSQFENSFFNLLSHLQVLIGHISGPVDYQNMKGKIVQGREYFYYQIRELKNLIYKENARIFANNDSKYGNIVIPLVKETNEPIDTNIYREFIEEIYDKFYKTRYSYLGHYFRFVFNLIRFVDDSPINNSQKKKYVNLIQAQMSSDELGLILYNGIGKFGKEKLHPLLERYEFLSNIDGRILENSNYIIRLYPKTHFKFTEFENQKF